MEPPFEAHTGTPYVLAALICDEAEQAPDGRHTIHNVANGLILKEPPANGTTFDRVLWIALHADGLDGDHDLHVQVSTPSSQVAVVVQDRISLGDSLKGIRVPIRGFPIFETGTYHWDVFLDGRLAARVPFPVVFVEWAQA